MKLKLFEEFGLFNKDKGREDNTWIKKSNFFIDAIPYGESQFSQEKYRVYIKSGEKTYYIGDVRRWKSNDEYLSYLYIDGVREIVPTKEIVPPNEKVMNIINTELFKMHLSSDLMGDDMTYLEFLKNKKIL